MSDAFFVDTLRVCYISHFSLCFLVTDMTSGANHFFYFLGCLIGLECVGQSYARLLSALVRKQVTASALSSISILICGTVGGFMPSYSQIPWVLRWLSWVTPVSYAFEGMMINQFGGGQSVSGVAFSDENSVTSDGGFDGRGWLSVYELPRAKWGTLNEIKIFDLFMLLVFALVYDFIGFYYVEHTKGWSSRRVQASVRTDFLQLKQSRNVESSKESAGQKQSKEEEEDSMYPATLSVRNLKYVVPLGSSKRCTIQSLLGPCLIKLSGKSVEKQQTNEQNELTLLNNVDACFRRGRMTALMGPSGCGEWHVTV